MGKAVNGDNTSRSGNCKKTQPGKERSLEGGWGEGVGRLNACMSSNFEFSISNIKHLRD